jgi:pimeloyl-ACP methyl ester carboxylesterase
MNTKAILHGGMKWQYHEAGTGHHSILILTGSLGANRGTATLLSELLPELRIIVPEYSPVRTVAEATEALDQIVANEVVEPLAVYGGSFGGLLAQCWIQQTSHRITHLILSGTTPVDPARVGMNRRMLGLLPYVPMVVIRLLLYIALTSMCRGAGLRHVWKKHYLQLIENIQKEDFASRYHMAIDLDSNYRFLPLPPKIPVLLLQGERDRIAKASSELLRIYPDAQTHMFRGAGHSAMVTHSQEWAEIVNRFVLRN